MVPQSSNLDTLAVSPFVSSPEHKCLETYCQPRYLVVVVVVVIHKLQPFFSHTQIDSCYLNLVTAGKLHCLLTTLVSIMSFINAGNQHKLDYLYTYMVHIIYENNQTMQSVLQINVL